MAKKSVKTRIENAEKVIKELKNTFCSTLNPKEGDLQKFNSFIIEFIELLSDGGLSEYNCRRFTRMTESSELNKEAILDTAEIYLELLKKWHLESVYEDRGILTL